ncbi:MAG: hypothetical protein ACI9XP_000469 [Lentimonas sp.]
MSIIQKSSFFKFLSPGPEDEVIEREKDFLWFDENGILCTVSKDDIGDVSIDELQKIIDEWEKEHKGETYYMLSVYNPKAKMNKAQRDFISKVYSKYINALAVINDSAMGRMAINLFIAIQPPPYPLKMFKDEKSAKAWLISIKNNNE